MNKMVHALLFVAILGGVALLYLLAAVRQGQIPQPLSLLVVFGGVSLAFWLASLLPNIVRRCRGLPPKSVAASKAIFSHPLCSPEAKDIYAHLTPDESRRLTAYSTTYGAFLA